MIQKNTDMSQSLLRSPDKKYRYSERLIVVKNKVPAAVTSKHYQSYLVWLQRASLSDQSKRAYRARVGQFLDFLTASDIKIDSLLKDQRNIELVLGRYKLHLKRSRKLLPNSVNASLTAIDHFLHFLGLPGSKVSREDFHQEAPRLLSPDEQKRFLEAAHAGRRAIDRAVPLLLINTGISIGECAALNLADVSVASRKSQITIRGGKGDRYREIPLNELAREALSAWLLERKVRFEQGEVEDALFLNPQGRRMTGTSLDRIVRKAGEACGIDLSSNVLRHTCLTNLMARGNDLILVAAIGGHKRLETTRRYAISAKLDMRQALHSLLIDE